MCKYYAYVRVSTSKTSEKQDYERQRFILSNSGIEFSGIFEEHISGGVRGDQRQEFNKMLAVLEEGDVVCFTETSRFGRNYKDNFEILDLLTLEKNCKVRFLSNNLCLEGGQKLNPYTWLTLSNFFIMDEFQKRLISYNTSNKLQALKQQGVKLGAPIKIKEDVRAEILDLYLDGFSQNKISQILNVSRTVISNVIKNGV